MKRFFSLIIYLLSVSFVLSQEVEGSIFSEYGTKIDNAMIVNIKTNEKTYTNAEGKFRISAKKGEEIRVIKKGYDRLNHTIKEEDLVSEISLKMFLAEKQIAEVVITKLKLTGDLAKDSKLLDKESQKESLRKALGMAEIEKQVRSLSSSGMTFDPNNLFGKEKRHKKSVAKYEAQENNADWIRLRINDDYFTEKGVPQERINEFLIYALAERTELNAIIRAKNITRVRAILEELFPVYLDRLKIN